jgi:hypothetical protein
MEITRTLSLGAGVQSTTMLLMAQHGLIDRPDVAIFADTGWEPPAVYQHLQWLEGVIAGFDNPIPILRVTKGNIRDDAYSILQQWQDTPPIPVADVRSDDYADLPLFAPSAGPTKRRRVFRYTRVGQFPQIPFYTTNKAGQRAQLRRQCTAEYKVRPILSKIRELTGMRGKKWKGSPVIMQIGISLDEAHRMKPAYVKWTRNDYPLVRLRMTRADCIAWLIDRGYPIPPKSSCIGCPFHGNKTWRTMRDSDPASFADAVQFDESMRHLVTWDAPVYVHTSLTPLASADLSTPMDHGQSEMIYDDGSGSFDPEYEFDAECDGVCGV